MGSSSEAKEHAAFEEKVKRTVYIGNLSPLVTESVIRTALNQFGNVTNVQFIRNYIGPRNLPAAALLEMENAKQADQIVDEITNFPFMMSGMLMPVKALKAEKEMFDNCPRKPRRRIRAQWLDPKDPEFETAKRIKRLAKKHAFELTFMLEKQLAEEEKLHNQQAENLKANFMKFDLIYSAKSEGCLRKPGSRYEIKIAKN